MASKALQKWLASRSTALDQIASAHTAIGGTGPGRRFATEQVVHAYAMLVSSHFQGFCRDLHSEVSDHIAVAASPAVLSDMVGELLTANRKLDMGNPNPGNIGSDFGRFGFTWDSVRNHDARNAGRQAKLELLNTWRNAIAHQDFTKPALGLGGGRTALRMLDVKVWRAACDGLAGSFDVVAADRVEAVMGSRPW